MKHIVSRSTQESKELKRSQETYFPQVQGTSLPTVDLDSMIGYEATHHGERSRPRYMSQVLPNAPMVTETHPSASNSERKSVRGDKRRARYASNAQVLSSPRSSLRSPLLFSHHLSSSLLWDRFFLRLTMPVVNKCFFLNLNLKSDHHMHVSSGTAKAEPG